jgi:hypothetical protein
MTSGKLSELFDSVPRETIDIPTAHESARTRTVEIRHPELGKRIQSDPETSGNYQLRMSTAKRPPAAADGL